MNRVGIEALNVFGGTAVVDVHELAERRGLASSRAAGLLMDEKAVALPFEDAVTLAACAARPVLDALTRAEVESIRLLITCTESGIDFSKSTASYLHDVLGLSSQCRVFEVKQACYSGTAGLQMAAAFVLSQAAPGTRALVVATDLSRYAPVADAAGAAEDWSYAEPSGGAGAVALLVGRDPRVFDLDIGASGLHAAEVMDTCRPAPDTEFGDVDLSLLSYLDCCENAYRDYARSVADVRYDSTFDHLAFHTPFGGMVKGAHRSMMRKFAQASPEFTAADFERRVEPGLAWCRRVGNIMGGTVFLSLASTIANADITTTRRVGCFSYGSGCASEFYSGVVSPESVSTLAAMSISEHLDSRLRLDVADYDDLVDRAEFVRFGTRTARVDHPLLAEVVQASTVPRLVLRGITDHHREYEWT
ncbi:hydroxymethylglutaryl-CoA synthase family protein [Rathayibacter tritici]|uniref:Polyketide biosynthesis 3-hydroxy-3-methylglutaryl-ACP synthase PksG n=1 Tax=Rathayibacter tritici TaxID=33888 RepID=A0A160KQV9_9MICO|nr:hydroxymethylglutaryl-CoA synthase [Rathayibacter tritici]AND15932.1 Polyketide biosynthesis 3-hydroxy-3-methylglutaryl-ACP synthase PksG [Rathayibacter tritici]PPI41067.1 3-hydroxy-3-methylglutaryl-ACP synthase [Rathayibacter tritici]